MVWHHYLTCFSESAGTPLLDFVSAPWVKKFRIEGVTISDCKSSRLLQAQRLCILANGIAWLDSNWDEFSKDPIVRLNASGADHLLDGLTITASSGGTSHSAVEVVSGTLVGTTLMNGHWCEFSSQLRSATAFGLRC